MARQTDHAQLIALGLLNYADDYGYFFADPKLVRSALRPFDDDSTNVRRSLDSLAKAGYIEVREHPTHGNLGRVVSFMNHQRVDRPKDSIIKELFDSTNDRRMIDDQSPLEGKGREGKGKEEREAAAPSVSLKSDLQRRAEKLHNKRESTPWDRAELTAWKHARAAVEATTEAEWAALEYFHSQPQEKTYARKSLAQTLNNWGEAISKAQAYAPRNQPRANLVYSDECQQDDFIATLQSKLNSNTQ